MAKKQAELTDAVRITRFEVDTVAGDWRETTRRWHALADEVKEMTNCLWQTWLLWHAQNDSRTKWREWYESRKTNGAEAAGKCPVRAWNSELGKIVYRAMIAAAPEAHTRVVTLLMNALQRKISARKAASGSLPGWTAILLYRESLPSSTRPQPILFDRANSDIIPPAETGGAFKIRVRMSRVPRDGKKAISIEDEITLRCRGRKVQSQVAILRRIATGEYAFRGSQLLYDDRKNKWYAMICYRMPAKKRQPLDPAKRGILIFGTSHPLLLVVGDDAIPIGGTGDYVAEQRRRIFLQRRSRSENYRFTGESRKGHGRQRNDSWRWRLQAAWSQFVKRCNHGWSRRVIDICVDRRIGEIVFFQPHGRYGDLRYVSKCGKRRDWNDATTWEFFQMKTFLAQKCQEAGIVFSHRKSAQREAAKSIAADQVRAT